MGSMRLEQRQHAELEVCELRLLLLQGLEGERRLCKRSSLKVGVFKSARLLLLCFTQEASQEAFCLCCGATCLPHHCKPGSGWWLRHGQQTPNTHGGVHGHGGTPSSLVDLLLEKPMKMDDLGVPLWLRKPPHGGPWRRNEGKLTFHHNQGWCYTFKTNIMWVKQEYSTRLGMVQYYFT